MANIFTKMRDKIRNIFKPNIPEFITKPEAKEMKKKQKTINKINLKEDKEVAKIRKKDTTAKGKASELIAGSTLKPRRELTKKVETFETREKFEDYMNRLDKLATPEYRVKQKEQLKTNFINGLHNTFGGDADDLIELVKQMDADNFVQMYRTYDVLNFNYWSDTKGSGRPYADDEAQDMLWDMEEAIYQFLE